MSSIRPGSKQELVARLQGITGQSKTAQTKGKRLCREFVATKLEKHSGQPGRVAEIVATASSRVPERWRPYLQLPTAPGSQPEGGTLPPPPPSTEIIATSPQPRPGSTQDDAVRDALAKVDLRDRGNVQDWKASRLDDTTGGRQYCLLPRDAPGWFPDALYAPACDCGQLVVGARQPRPSPGEVRPDFIAAYLNHRCRLVDTQPATHAASPRGLQQGDIIALVRGNDAQITHMGQAVRHRDAWWLVGKDGSFGVLFSPLERVLADRAGGFDSLRVYRSKGKDTDKLTPIVQAWLRDNPQV